MALVELLRISAVQALHAAGECVASGVEDEVIVRRHQAERLHRPVEAFDGTAEMAEELTAILVVAVDVAAACAAGEHVEVPVGQ